MERIENISGLAKLRHKEKFFRIYKGFAYQYIYAGVHPVINDAVIAIHSEDLTKAIVFTRNSFGSDTVFMRGTYQSEEMGTTMVEQLEYEIEAIKRIYIKPHHARKQG